MEKIKSSAFYRVWFETVTKRRDKLEPIWRNFKQYTLHIKGSENCVLDEIAENLELLCYSRDYYSIDSIFYKQEDLVDKIKEGTYWFKDIRIAFEHENNFNGGLYQEVSHLLIINADLKVLVTYPVGNITTQLNYLHEIISGNRSSKTISDEESFLIIFGYENDFLWEGLVYKENGWKNIMTQEIFHYRQELKNLN